MILKGRFQNKKNYVKLRYKEKEKIIIHIYLKKKFSYSKLKLSDISIDGSLANIKNKPESEKESAKINPDGKFAFSIWTTTRVTSTATVKFTNTSTTISLLYVCTVGGLEFPSAFSCVT